MNEEEQAAADALEQQKKDALETSNEGQEETIEEVKAKLAKAEEIAENQKIRAEKAEKLAKGSKETVVVSKSPKAGDMKTDDLYALMNAKVPQDDIQDVREYAELKGISVADALKSNVVKTILSDKAEQRNIAEATHVGNARRNSSKSSEEALLAGASKGELPDSDDEMQRLWKARKGIK